jgi:molybdopterin converting factor small subunit
VKVRVKVYGHLQTLFGEKDFSIDLPYQSTLNDLISYIGKAFGAEKAKELRPAEGTKFPLMIIVGNKDHRFLNGMQTALTDGVIVYFMPPAVGG